MQTIPPPTSPRFDRISWSVLVFACILVLGSLGQRLYRFTLPTDGWSFENGTIGGDSQDRPHFLTNLLNAPSPIQPGDWLMEVEGEPEEAFLRRAFFFQPQPAILWKAGNTVRYTVLRDGEMVQLDVPLYTWPVGLAARKLLLSTEVWSAFILAGIGWFVFSKRPREWSARALLLFSNSLGASMLSSAVVGTSVGDLLVSHPFPWVVLFYSNFIFAMLMMPSALLLALTFPHPKGWVRRHLLPVVGLLYGIIPLLWLIAGFDKLAPIGWVGALVFLLVTAITFGHTFFTARGISERAQIRWAILGLIAGIISLAGAVLVGLGVLPWIPAWLGTAIFSLGFIVSASGFGIAILRYHLYDIDWVINRALVYASLTVIVVGIYIVIVGYLGMLFQNQGSLGISLLGTAVVAILFDNLRRRIQHLVNRLMYGERDDPYRVLARLGQQLEAAIEPEAALSIAVETVAHALKLPYVAVALKQEDSWKIIVEYGAKQSKVARFPLIHAGEMIGEMVTALRAPGEPFNQSDQRLLSDLARQVSVTAHATMLANELERARLRLVTAREEARRRLGSDLHDGVGHTLAGLARQSERVKDLLIQDPTAAQSLLNKLNAQLANAISQVRQLAHQLYPPELELLGLVGALRERIQANAYTNFIIRADMPETLPPLPTAIESAAYYITLEALSNVAKHAGAISCQFKLALINGDSEDKLSALELEICDDGQGLTSDGSSGLGLLSMQARAAEVGGLCTIEENPDGGTRVSVRLPCQV